MGAYSERGPRRSEPPQRLSSDTRRTDGTATSLGNGSLENTGSESCSPSERGAAQRGRGIRRANKEAAAGVRVEAFSSAWTENRWSWRFTRSRLGMRPAGIRRAGAVWKPWASLHTRGHTGHRAGLPGPHPRERRGSMVPGGLRAAHAAGCPGSLGLHARTEEHCLYSNVPARK